MQPGEAAGTEASLPTKLPMLLTPLPYAIIWPVSLCRYAPQLVKRVVKDVLDRLGRPALHVADMPVDLEQRVAAIRQQLTAHAAMGSAVLGLYGMGGIGKTTLAKAVFNDLRSAFGGRSCFVDVGREAGRQELQRMQEQMLKELCGIDRQVSNLDAGTAELQARLGHARVLLVLDDIWSTVQLDALLVSVAQGSHVVATTRDENLLRRPSIPLRQPVELLDEDAAIELFSWSAFLQKRPPAAYNRLARDAVKACSGLPLALRIIGAHLWGLTKKGDWEQAVLMLRSAKPFGGGSKADDAMWGKLLLSYNSLDSAEQQMFLDIVCILLGRRPRHCLPVWGPVADSMLQNLMNRSLVSEDIYGNLEVHDQLRDMGRAIVVEEHMKAGQRSRLWMPEALEVIRHNQVSLLLKALLSCHTHRHAGQF